MNLLPLDEEEKPSEYLKKIWEKAKNSHPFYPLKFKEKWEEFPEFHNCKCAFMLSYRSIYFGQVDLKGRPYGFGASLSFEME